MKDKLITKEAYIKTLKSYWLQYKKHPWYAAGCLFIPAIGSIFIGFIPPLVIARLVNLIATPELLTVTLLAQYISIFAGSWLFGEFLWRIGYHLLSEFELRGMSNLAKEAFNDLSEREYDFYTDNFVGTLTKRASAYSKGFEIFTDTFTFTIFPLLFPFIFATIILSRYSFWFPLILLIMISISIAISIPIIKRRAKIVAKRHDAASRMSGQISDSITNILAVKSFAQEKKEQHLFEERVDEYSHFFRLTGHYQNIKLDSVIAPLYVLTNAFGLIATMFFTLKLHLPAGTMIIVFSYYAQITRVFWDINRVYRNIESAFGESAEFAQLVLNPPAIQDIPDAKSLIVKNSNIKFENVAFSYGKDKDAELFLNNFNLEIKGNQRVGLVGPSGGGKTTITKLILRFIDLQSGQISIDGQDIKKVSQKSLRESIAYVPQESLLFHRSLFDNIAYGDEKATIEDVMNAAKLARADEFIEKLPHKYDTLVGERGIKLSGGQRQRIAIARALLKKAPILVLDEATSSLDSESEKYIQEGLWELMKNRTALVIAHRLSTIKHLDRIIVLENGKIVQDGTHEELIKQPGLYAKLWSHQSGEFLAE